MEQFRLASLGFLFSPRSSLMIVKVRTAMRRSTEDQRFLRFQPRGSPPGSPWGYPRGAPLRSIAPLLWRPRRGRWSWFPGERPTEGKLRHHGVHQGCQLSKQFVEPKDCTRLVKDQPMVETYWNCVVQMSRNPRKRLLGPLVLRLSVIYKSMSKHEGFIKMDLLPWSSIRYQPLSTGAEAAIGCHSSADHHGQRPDLTVAWYLLHDTFL